MNAAETVPLTAPAHGHDPEAPEPPPRRPSLARLVALVLLAAGLFAGLTVAGLRARAGVQVEREAATVAVASDRPRVLTTKVEPAPPTVEQLLPGTAAPLLDTGIYARTSGYLKRWLVDIGDEVKEGQLLAEIETPEVDAQLLQARAALLESRATHERNKASATLARISLDRSKLTVDRGVGAQQNLDDAEAALKVSDATVHVSEATIAATAANVKRLEDLQRFQKVTAPFAGVITARNYDPGALIVADNATAKELFHLAQMDTIRVFVDVPQTLATAVRVGRTAHVFRREEPANEFAGSVTRTTSSVDPRTRTLRAEVDVPNPGGGLLPGMYLQVRFRLDAPKGVFRLPGAAIITRADGAKVAVLDAQSAIRYRPVKVGRDFGAQVEVVTGLAGGETVVLRPGDDMPEGTLVDPVAAGR